MSPSLRILLVVHGLPPEFFGGTESYVAALARALDARGLEVALLTGSSRAADPPMLERAQLDHLQVFRLHRRGLYLDSWDRSFDPEAEALYRQLLREWNPDVVHVHHWVRLTRTLIATAAEEGIPSVVTLHDAWTTCPRCFRVRDDGFCDRPIGPASCTSCVTADPFLTSDRVAAAVSSFAADLRDELRLSTVRIVPSRSHRDLISRHSGLPATAFRVLPHGTLATNIARCRPSEDGVIRLAHWGHLYPMKGYHVLLEALALSSPRVRARFETHVFGEAFDADYAARLTVLEASLLVHRHGSFVPRDLGGRALDLAVFPSLAHESHSFVLDEAFLLGLPVLVSARGALAERVGDAGATFAPESAAALATRLEEIAADPSRLLRYRAAVPPVLSMELHGARMEAVYRDAVLLAGRLERPDPGLRSERVRTLYVRSEDLFRTVLDLRGRLHQIEVTKARLEDAFASASTAAADSAAAQRDFAESVRELEAELGRRDADLAAFQESTGRLAAEIERRETVLTSYRKAVDELQAELAARARVVAGFERSVEELRRESLECSRAVAGFEATVATLRGEVNRRDVQLGEFAASVTHLEASLAAAEENGRRVDSDRRSAYRALEEFRVARDDLGAALESERRRSEAAEVDLRRREREFAILAEEHAGTREAFEVRLQAATAAAAHVEAPVAAADEDVIGSLQRELAEERRRSSEARTFAQHAESMAEGLTKAADALRGRLSARERELALLHSRCEGLEAGRRAVEDDLALAQRRTAAAEALAAERVQGMRALAVELELDASSVDEWTAAPRRLAEAAYGLRRQLLEMSGDLERVREERDVCAAAKGGLERELEDLRALAPPGSGRSAATSARRKEAVGGLRILMVVHQFLPRHAAGSEIYTFKLAKAMQARHQVHLAFTEAHYGIPQYRMREGSYEGLPFTEIVHQHDPISFERTWRDPRMDVLFERILDRVRPDVVHFQHSHYFGIGCVQKAIEWGVPVVYTLHEYLLLCPRGGQMRRADGGLCARPEPSACAECIRHKTLDADADDMAQFPLWRQVARHVPVAARRFVKDLLPAPTPKPRSVAPASDYEAAISERLAAIATVLAGVDLFISPSRFLKERFVDAGMLPADRILHSDNGMDPTPFRDLSSNSSSSLRVGFIGSVAEYKGVHVLIEAMNSLLDRSDILCRIHGSLESFPAYGESLRALSRNPRVQFAGGYDNARIGEVLAELDVIVVPSLWYENSPLTIHEAYLARVPVLASDLGGMAEFVEAEVSGLLFPPGDASALAGQLVRLRDEPGLRTRLVAGRPTIKTIEEDALAMEARYERLRSQRNREVAR